MNPVPLPAEIEEACRRVIAEWELDKFVEPILQATTVTLLCENARDETRERAPLGSTKLGGFPDLPAHAEWPKYNDRFLPFIAQINLADLPVFKESPLPSAGRLYYFYWCTNEVRDNPAAVLWLSDDTADLTRREVPSDQIVVDWQNESLYEEEGATRHSLGVTVSLPLAEKFAKQDISELWGDDFANEYQNEVRIRLEHGLDIWERLGEGEGISREYWRLIELLGYPDPENYFLHQLEPAPAGGHTDGTDLWRNILDIGSHNNMMWSDVGSLVFLHPRGRSAPPRLHPCASACDVVLASFEK
jgi:hypothetical protein